MLSLIGGDVEVGMLTDPVSVSGVDGDKLDADGLCETFIGLPDPEVGSDIMLERVGGGS